jgi:hypothetical protein
LVGNTFATVANHFGLNVVPPNYLQGFDTHSLALGSKGKGKFKEIEFDAAFAQAASSLEIVSPKVETQSSRTSMEELEAVLAKAKLDDIPVVTPDQVINEVEFKRFVRFNLPTMHPLTSCPFRKSLGAVAKFRPAP